jgi:hypothetical protein
MDTCLQLRVTVSDDTLIGNAQLIVWRQSGGCMKESARPFQGVAILPTLEDAGSPYQWAITALRDTADRAVARMMEAMNEGKEEVMLVHSEGEQI